MALLTCLLGVRRYLEIGACTGYSALAVALAMEADGQVVTCEIDEAIARTAKRHWRHAGLVDKIEFRLGLALRHWMPCWRKACVGTLIWRSSMPIRKPASFITSVVTP